MALTGENFARVCGYRKKSDEEVPWKTTKKEREAIKSKIKGLQDLRDKISDATESDEEYNVLIAPINKVIAKLIDSM
jgi:hypothetical protein